MNVRGTRIEYNVEIEITDRECLKRMYSAFKFGKDYFIKDNKIFKWIDVSTHRSEYKEELVTEDIDKVEQLKALEVLGNGLGIRF